MLQCISASETPKVYDRYAAVYIWYRAFRFDTVMRTHVLSCKTKYYPSI